MTLAVCKCVIQKQLLFLKTVIEISVRSRRSVPAPLKPLKHKGEGTEAERFVDFKKIRVIGGRGGNGCLSFLSEAHHEFAGPDGGNGGNGGHVIFQAKKNEKALNHLQTVTEGNHGVPGRNKGCDGKCAEHLYIKVPVGTIVKDMEGNILSNLEDENDYCIAARGGAGGKGNRSFASAYDTAPHVAELGAGGEVRELYIELRIMAHAGLIGFPNAGKSTLLRAISRAKPKVSSAPFTTLHPHIGMVEYEDYEQIAVADIPGLIPGAHADQGLGIAFLRHIQRCTCLLYVLDLSESEPWRQLEALKYELEQYEKGLSERPHAVIGNKMDLPVAKKNLKNLQKHTNLPVFPISAANRSNITPLLLHLRELYDEYSEKEDVGW